MTILTTFAHRLMTAISLLTAAGVFLHDGRVDRAANTVLSRPAEESYSKVEVATRFNAFLENDAHAHPDHNAARTSLLSSFDYQSPSIPPRNQEHKKHLLQEYRSRGHHAFDNYNLPVVD